jgi:fatty acid desaturase
MVAVKSGHGAGAKSWAIAALIAAGFIVGGVALILWSWPMFWVGVAIVAVGIVLAWVTNMMEDVEEYGAHGTGDPTPTSR